MKRHYFKFYLFIFGVEVGGTGFAFLVDVLFVSSSLHACRRFWQNGRLFTNEMRKNAEKRFLLFICWFRESFNAHSALELEGEREARRGEARRGEVRRGQATRNAKA